jgi:hypothetical protein
MPQHVKCGLSSRIGERTLVLKLRNLAYLLIDIQSDYTDGLEIERGRKRA